MTSAKSLIKRGLMIATPGDGAGVRHIITAEGRGAVDPVEPQSPAPDACEPERIEDPVATRPRGTKTAALLNLLQRPEGATVAQMSEATGWLAHSVRGFMAGALKKKHGYLISSEKIEGLRIYRAMQAEAA